MFLYRKIKTSSPAGADSGPPLGTLVVRVLEAVGLTPADRNGLADPFVKIRIGNLKKESEVIKESLAPTWSNAKIETPVAANFLENNHIEIVVWDRDTFSRNDYLGEANLSISECFPKLDNGSSRPVGINDPLNKPTWHALVSTKSRAIVQGRILVHVGFIIESPQDALRLEKEVDNIIQNCRSYKLHKHSRLLTAPPTESVGTMPISFEASARTSHDTEDYYSDDQSSAVSSSIDDDESDSDPDDFDELEQDQEQQQQQSFIESKLAKKPSTGSMPSELVPPPHTSKKNKLQSLFRRTPSSKSIQSDPNFSGAPSIPSSALQSPLPTPSSEHSPATTAPSSSAAAVLPPSSTDDAQQTRRRKSSSKRRRRRKRHSGHFSLASQSDIMGVCFIQINSAANLPRQRNVTRTGFDMDPFVITSCGKRVFRTKVVRHSLNPVWDERLYFPVHQSEQNFEVHFSVFDWDKLSANDYVGDAKLLLSDLIAASPKPDPATGLYDTTTEGQLTGDKMQTFNLPLISLQASTSSSSNSNDPSPSPSPNLSSPSQFISTDDLSSSPTMPSSIGNGNNGNNGNGSGSSSNGSSSNSVGPTITVHAKMLPYDAIRQQFWRIFMENFDTDDSFTFNRTELLAMLDSLGSTLSPSTINSSFFGRFGKDEDKDELTFEQVMQCLEAEISKPDEQKKKLLQSSSPIPSNASSSSSSESISDGKQNEQEQYSIIEKHEHQHPIVVVSSSHPTASSTSNEPDPILSDNLAGLNLTGHAGGRVDDSATSGSRSPSGGAGTSGSEEFLDASDLDIVDRKLKDSQSSLQQQQVVHKSGTSTPSTTTTAASGLVGPSMTSAAAPPTTNSPGTGPTRPGASTPIIEPDNANEEGELFERIINIKTCPICHKPPRRTRRRRQAKIPNQEFDMVTHIALCASKDWSTAGSFMVSNFVTSDQAHRKWLTKAFTKISSGSYQLGANSANIIVQDRRTGRLQEEKMQIYVRLGIRLLYKGFGSNRMEGNRIRSLLKSMSVKQGIKFDSPESVAEIGPFIEFHNLNIDEVRDPLSSFKTFNDFFYRRLKPDARPVSEPDNPNVFVSCADCRMVAFQTVDEATRIWIKGREFSIRRLLGPQFADEAHKYDGCSLAVFRLAPQDYHRYHSPVDGLVQDWSEIDGEYYTVNPMAVRSHLDLYGENIRRVLPIDSPQFGRVMNVAIGAMMVGSIVFTVEPGQEIKRGDEYGYFAFGGSTIVVLIPPNTVKFDDDILSNSSKCIESLVRVGERIGVRV